LDEAEIIKDNPEKLKKNLEDFEETIRLLPTATDLTSAAAGEPFSILMNYGEFQGFRS
jgi:hypothetical protein